VKAENFQVHVTKSVFLCAPVTAVQLHLDVETTRPAMMPQPRGQAQGQLGHPMGPNLAHSQPAVPSIPWVQEFPCAMDVPILQM
jgi:hypothetical protein